MEPPRWLNQKFARVQYDRKTFRFFCIGIDVKVWSLRFEPTRLVVVVGLIGIEQLFLIRRIQIQTLAQTLADLAPSHHN